MKIATTVAALALVGAGLLGASAPAQARYCEGRVYGLSRNYDPDTGSGFLAVRTRPNAHARQFAELFNGDRFGIVDRRGNWYQIELDGGLGWANARWIRNSCGW